MGAVAGSPRRRQRTCHDLVSLQYDERYECQHELSSDVMGVCQGQIKLARKDAGFQVNGLANDIVVLFVFTDNIVGSDQGLEGLICEQSEDLLTVHFAFTTACRTIRELHCLAQQETMFLALTGPPWSPTP